MDAGPKVRSFHMLQYLASAGHEVTLTAFRRASDRPEYLTHLEQYCAMVHTVPMQRSRGKDLWHLGTSILQKKPFLITRDHVEAMQSLIRSLVNEQQFDAIHADQLWMAQYALDAKASLNGQSKRTRYVLDQHNAVYLIPQRLASEVGTGRAKRWILQREARSLKDYETAACREFDTVVWVTDDDRRLIEAATPATINSVTIPICVDPEEKTAVDRAPGARRVTFLGGLHWPPPDCWCCRCYSTSMCRCGPATARG